MGPWVIFDADNTLWETESLYDDARRTLTNMLASRGVDAAIAGEMQQAIDEELYKTFGYSAQRFPASFDRTLVYFFPTSSEEERAQIRRQATI
jgi:FMN phosphatase YigB (HAD superfamily)